MGPCPPQAARPGHGSHAVLARVEEAAAPSSLPKQLRRRFLSPVHKDVSSWDAEIAV